MMYYIFVQETITLFSGPREEELIISIRKTTCYAAQILWEFLEFEFIRKYVGVKNIYT